MAGSFAKSGTSHHVLALLVESLAPGLTKAIPELTRLRFECHSTVTEV